MHLSEALSSATTVTVTVSFDITASATDPGSWMPWLRPGFHYLWWPGAAPY